MKRNTAPLLLFLPDSLCVCPGSHRETPGGQNQILHVQLIGMKKSAKLSLLAGGFLLVMVSSCEPDNVPPVAYAGPDLGSSVAYGSVDLKGSAFDADGTVVSYRWTKLSGPASYTLVQPASAVSRVNDLVEGAYVFQLTVTDDDGLTDTDDVLVTVYVPGPWDY